MRSLIHGDHRQPFRVGLRRRCAPPMQVLRRRITAADGFDKCYRFYKACDRPLIWSKGDMIAPVFLFVPFPQRRSTGTGGHRVGS